MQTYVRDKLGFADLVMPVQVDVDGSDLDTSIHACYSDTPEGDGYLSFGHRPGAFLAEDGELVAHEYGHVLLFRTTAGRFEIARDASHPESEAGAISEGFADYWALSTFYEKTKASGHRIDCFGEWAKGGPCMRTASDKSFHDDFIDGANDHVNGEVWLSMLFDLFRAMHFDRDKANTIILLGHLNRADRGLAPTMAEIADGIVGRRAGVQRPAQRSGMRRIHAPRSQLPSVLRRENLRRDVRSGDHASAARPDEAAQIGRSLRRAGARARRALNPRSRVALQLTRGGQPCLRAPAEPRRPSRVTIFESTTPCLREDAATPSADRAGGLLREPR